ncbi:putative ribonuclease H-like domain-containing protein, partial [Tanacetum coccineum]
PDPSPRPSLYIPIPDSNLEDSSGNHRGQSSSDGSLSGNENGLTLQSVYDLCVSLYKQVTAQAAEIKGLKAQIKQLKKRKKSIKKKLMQKDSVSKQGRKNAKSKPTIHEDPAFDDLDDILDDAMDYLETEDAQNEESTDKPAEGTDRTKVSTDRQVEGTVEPKDRNSDESVAPTTVFRDDETIAQFLVAMSQNKAKLKGFEIKDIEDTDRPRTTT